MAELSGPSESKVLKDGPVGRLKILQIFSRYLQRGGEEVFSEAFRRALGPSDTVENFEGSSAAWMGNAPLARFSLPGRIFHDSTVAASLRARQKSGSFDLWVIQNALPGLTPAVYETAFRLGVPVVHYLHNYRLGCTNGFLLNHGRPCERCLDGNFWPAFATACWRENRLISGMMGLVLRRVRALGTFHRVAAWIALNRGQKDTHMRMGIPPEKIHVVPHFFETRDSVPPPKPDGDILFLGRLSPEKGLDVLLRAWALVRPGTRSLVIAGTGPEEASLRDLAKALKLSSVRFAGFVAPEDQPALWAQTSFSVLPSIWHEPFPLSFLESWAHARPVVASRVGAMAEEVTEGVTGFLAEPFSENSLASKIQGMMDQPDQSVAMGLAGAKKVKEEHNRELWLQRIRQIFSNVLTPPGNREFFRP